jgi:ATP-dependent Clp protease ATP-binding subunit ClpC
MKDIVILMIKELQKRLKDQDIEFTLTDKAIEKIAKEGFDPEYGARPLRRSIQKNIEDKLSEELLKGTISKGQKVKIGLNSKGDFVILQ